MIYEHLTMVAHVVLLFLFFCKGEGIGISEATGLSDGDEDLRVIPSKKLQVLPHPESTDVLFEQIKELGRHSQDAEADVTPLLTLAFQLSGNNSAKKRKMLNHPQLRTEITVNGNKRSSLTNGEDGGVIDGLTLVQYSEEETYSDKRVTEVQPGRTRGDFEKVKESEGSHSLRIHRRRRSWLWNQFFVIEEYRGPEPVLIGRVCPTDCDISNQSGKEKLYPTM
ncbi:hypothetical protein ILYODFUR_016688 [Ilyodon furcidens]|uniref:Uncharacterized protein n=1 Tax=Ilyodon furcidens TaxID=33524 RepID=A0ABV0UA49_9TELE